MTLQGRSARAKKLAKKLRQSVAPDSESHWQEVVTNILNRARTRKELANMLRSMTHLSYMVVWEIDEFPPGIHPLSSEGVAWQLEVVDKNLNRARTRKQLENTLRALADFEDSEVWHLDEFPPEIDPHSWEGIAWKINNGDPPLRETIAWRLVNDTGPIPEVVLRYVAGLLVGQVKQKRGPRKDTLRHRMEAHFRAYAVRRVERLAERLKRRGVADAHTVAKEHVAGKTEIPVDTLDVWVYPRRRCTQPPLSAEHIQRLRRAYAVRRVERLSERLKRRGVADAHTVAKEHVAAKKGIPVDTLDAWIYPRQRRRT